MAWYFFLNGGKLGEKNGTLWCVCLACIVITFEKLSWTSVTLKDEYQTVILKDSSPKILFSPIYYSPLCWWTARVTFSNPCMSNPSWSFTDGKSHQLTPTVATEDNVEKKKIIKQEIGFPWVDFFSVCETTGRLCRLENVNRVSNCKVNSKW